MWLSPHKEGTRCALTRTHTQSWKTPLHEKGSGGMVVLSDPLQWLLLTAVTAEICQSCPRITTGTMPTGWKKKKKIKIKMQAVCTPPGKHTTQRTLTENIQPDLGPDIATDTNLDGSPGRGAESRSASTHRAPKRRRHKAGLCSLLLLLGFP